MSYVKKRKQAFTLIEILIAISVITLVLVPVLSPHFAILKEERRFIQEVHLDRIVNLLYTDTLKQLFDNKIDWQEIGSSKETAEERSVENLEINRLGFVGTRRLYRLKSKPKDNEKYHLVQIDFTFNRSRGAKEVFPYSFWVVIERQSVKSQEEQMGEKR